MEPETKAQSKQWKRAGSPPKKVKRLNLLARLWWLLFRNRVEQYWLTSYRTVKLDTIQKLFLTEKLRKLRASLPSLLFCPEKKCAIFAWRCLLLFCFICSKTYQLFQVATVVLTTVWPRHFAVSPPPPPHKHTHTHLLLLVFAQSKQWKRAGSPPKKVKRLNLLARLWWLLFRNRVEQYWLTSYRTVKLDTIQKLFLTEKLRKLRASLPSLLFCPEKKCAIFAWRCLLLFCFICSKTYQLFQVATVVLTTVWPRHFAVSPPPPPPHKHTHTHLLLLVFASRTVQRLAGNICQVRVALISDIDRYFSCRSTS